MKPYEKTPRALLREARRMGKAKGANAAGWITQELPGGGRYTKGKDSERAAELLQEIEDETPLELLPPDWLSGEWADEPSPRDIFLASGGDPDRDPEGETETEVADEFINAADAAWQTEIVRHLKATARTAS